jgi:hypothetical protein
VPVEMEMLKDLINADNLDEELVYTTPSILAFKQVIEAVSSCTSCR